MKQSEYIIKERMGEYTPYRYRNGIYNQMHNPFTNLDDCHRWLVKYRRGDTDWCCDKVVWASVEEV